MCHEGIPGHVRLATSGLARPEPVAECGVIVATRHPHTIRLNRRSSRWVTLTAGDDDLAAIDYWLTRPLSERFAAVEQLRREIPGTSARLQRVSRFVQRRRR